MSAILAVPVSVSRIFFVARSRWTIGFSKPCINWRPWITSKAMHIRLISGTFGDDFDSLMNLSRSQCKSSVIIIGNLPLGNTTSWNLTTFGWLSDLRASHSRWNSSLNWAIIWPQLSLARTAWNLFAATSFPFHIALYTFPYEPLPISLSSTRSFTWDSSDSPSACSWFMLRVRNCRFFLLTATTSETCWANKIVQIVN